MHVCVPASLDGALILADITVLYYHGVSVKVSVCIDILQIPETSIMHGVSTGHVHDHSVAVSQAAELRRVRQLQDAPIRRLKPQLFHRQRLARPAAARWDHRSEAPEKLGELAALFDAWGRRADNACERQTTILCCQTHISDSESVSL